MKYTLQKLQERNAANADKITPAIVERVNRLIDAVEQSRTDNHKKFDSTEQTAKGNTTMNAKQNFEKMSDALAVYMNGADDKKATIILETDFGGYSVLPVRLHAVSFGPYAQYRNAARITCTPKGKRTAWRMYLHEGKEFAIFAGWVTPGATIGTTTTTASGAICTTWAAFDKNEFYKLVDSTEGEKLAENSERVYLDELEKRGKVYKVCTLEGCTEYKTEAELLQAHEKTGAICDTIRRYELQGAPTLAGLCGPMFDGYDKDNNALIRYESSDLYALMSE